MKGQPMQEILDTPSLFKVHDFDFCPRAYGRKDCWCSILHTEISDDVQRYRQDKYSRKSMRGFNFR